MAALMPVISAGRNQNSQTILIGTPPQPGCPATVFSAARNRALDGDASRTCWHEWSVDEVGDISDWSRVEATNPAFNVRLMPSAVEAEMSAMSPEFFARERLGYWSHGSVEAVIPRERWSACATDSPPDDGVKCFATKFSPDGELVSVAVALKPRDGGKSHFELVHHQGTEDGIAWLSSWLAARKADTAMFVVDGVGSAENLRDAMVRLGVSKSLVKIPRASDMAAANSAFLDAIRGETVTYYQDEYLDAAALGCSKRKIGTNGGWGFRSEDGAEASILEAAALALWGVSTTRRDPKRKARMAW